MKEYNFNDDGFVILKKVFDEDALIKMRDFTDRIITDGEKDLEDPFSPYYMRHRTDQGALYDLYQRHPEFQELARNKQILDEIAKVYKIARAPEMPMPAFLVSLEDSWKELGRLVQFLQVFHSARESETTSLYGPQTS